MSKPLPWVKFETMSDGGGKFVVSPLERGMGITLGNSLRRVLLSSLSGYAITSLNIEGVKHEFSTISNVVEDVFDIICNLKGIVFKAGVEETVKLHISVSKKGKIKAKDIQLPAGVEILNPDWHIAEVSSDSKLKIEMTLNKGVGYAAAEAHLESGQPIDTINIDASFSPIVRVNHQVESIRVGKELDYDSLTLDVWTNGSISPEYAVSEASRILMSKFDLFNHLNQKPQLVDFSSSQSEVSSGQEKSKESALSLSIDDLELSARSSNCLKRAGIETVAELMEKDLSELIQIKNFGKKSADEINDKLKQYGLMLKGAEVY